MSDRIRDERMRTRLFLSQHVFFQIKSDGRWWTWVGHKQGLVFNKRRPAFEGINDIRGLFCFALAGNGSGTGVEKKAREAMPWW